MSCSHEPDEARTRREHLLRVGALRMIHAMTRHRWDIPPSRRSPRPIRVELHVHQIGQHGPDDDRVDQHWILYFESHQDTSQVAGYRWYLPEWDPLTEAVALFAPWCDPTRMGERPAGDWSRVAVFTPGLDGWRVEVEPMRFPERDGMLSNTERMRRSWADEQAEQAPAIGDIVRVHSPEATDRMRREFLDGPAADHVQAAFDTDPKLQSALLLVGQYYDDSALDEVHVERVWSEADEPSFVPHDDWYFDADTANLSGRSHEELDMTMPKPWWRRFRGGGDAISFLAAFCPENGFGECFVQVRSIRVRHRCSQLDATTSTEHSCQTPMLPT